MRGELRPPASAEALPGVEEGLAAYHAVFSRADQRECFRLYLLGLLTAPGRKNFEALAAASGRSSPGADLAQSLQHFVTQSPWDHGRLLARYRERLPAGLRASPGVWVVHDGVLLKKGRNSVGTQRQFARSLGRKVNCQVAVVVGRVSPAGYAPLAVRLYLPGYCLREHPELAQRTVPADQRRHATKAEIALALLDELRAADSAALDDGYATAEGFATALTERGIGTCGEPTPHLAAAGDCFERLKTRLGLDHFEGRTWVGWHHHAAMVLAAAGFLLGDRPA